ncbi:hypothetical protein [Pseudomonas anguilliseptica]|uniref:hypothetical protein n=1 Tax=Pseudomonas anguilliseptica TaxID=53406 RepID=UPI00325C1A8D
MRFLTRYFFAFFIMFCANFVSAADYIWVISYGGVFQGDSPSQACAAFFDHNALSADWILQNRRLERIHDAQFRCVADAQHKHSTYFIERNYIAMANRSGDSCSDPLATYNPETGDCEAPPKNECEEKAGDSVPYSKSGDMDDGYVSIATIDGKKLPVSPNEGCMGGCAVTVQSHCKSRISTNAYSCTGYAYYSGTACTASTETPQVEQEENYRPDEPENIEIKEPCVYTTDAEGRSVCVSKASLEKEGQSCGTYNGQTLCVPKQATKDEKTVETEVTETADADGGKTTVKKDVATVTKCVGSNKSCTTTTTTTTTKADGSGTTTKTDVVCKGANCGSGVGGVGSGDGSGTGDGEGEEGEEGGELEGQDEVAGFGESLQDFNTRIASAPILSTVTSIAMPRGGSCSMPSASIPVIGTVSFNWICDNANLLDPLYYVMLAIWALFAIRVFLEA